MSGISLDDFITDVKKTYNNIKVMDDVQISGMLLKNSPTQKEDISSIFQENAYFIFNYLIHPSKNNGECLLDNIKESAVKFYTDKIQEFIIKGD